MSEFQFLGAGQGGSSNTASVVSSAIDTTGATLLVVHVANATGVSATLTDHYGNTWTALTARDAGNNRSQLFYCSPPSNKRGSGHTVTVNNFGSYPSVQFLAFRTPPLVSVEFDQQSGATSGSGGTSFQPGSLTPGGNNGLVIGAVSTYVAAGGENFTSSNVTINASARTNTVDAQHYGGAIGYAIQTTAAALNPTISWTGTSGTRAAVAATFLFEEPAELVAFRDIRTMGFAHIGLQTYDDYADAEFGTVTPITNFNPTAYDQWETVLDESHKRGDQAFILMSKHHPGFCPWDTATHGYSAPNSPAGRDVFADMVRAVEMRGMQKILYFSVEDLFHGSAGYTGGLTLQQLTIAQLTELLDGTYGDFAMVFLDGWGNTWSVDFGDVDYPTIYNLIKSLQPECLVCVNDHEGAGGAATNDPHGDVGCLEYNFDGETPVEENTFGAWWLGHTIHKNGYWFQKHDSPLLIASDAGFHIGQRFRINNQGFGYALNLSPGPNGRVHADAVTCNAELWDATAAPLVDEDFAAGSQANLQTLTGWSKTFGTQNAQVGAPSGDVWVNNDTVTYINTDSTTAADFSCALPFNFATLPTNCGVGLALSTGEQIYLTKTGSTVSFAMWLGGAFQSSYGIDVSHLSDSLDYSLNIKRVNGQFSGEFRKQLGGELVPMGRLWMAAVGGEATVSFYLSSIGSATTGLHITGFVVAPVDTTPPAAPTLELADDVLTVTKSADTERVKIHRYDAGRWVLAKLLEAADFTDNVAEWTDEEVEDMAELAYRATALDASWNESEPASAGSVAPAITSNGAGETATVRVVEGDTTVTTVAADGEPTPTFSITGGNDAAKFTIDEDTGVLAFLTAPVFRRKADADGNGLYEVEVTASNTAGDASQLISVFVLDRLQDRRTKDLSDLLLYDDDPRKSRGERTFLQSSGTTNDYAIGHTLELVDGVYVPATGETCDAVLLANIRAASGVAISKVPMLVGGPAKINRDALEFEPALSSDVEAAQVASLLSNRIACVSESPATSTGGE